MKERSSLLKLEGAFALLRDVEVNTFASTRPQLIEEWAPLIPCAKLLTEAAA